MILDISLQKDKKGKILDSVSKYIPETAEKEKLQQIMQHFSISREIMNKPYREFNDRSLIQRQSEDQARFNIYVEPKSEDPDERWKSLAVRPIVRNRAISIAAHVTGRLIFPLIFAQNDRDEEDRDASVVMRDLMEWVGDQSNYARTFLYSVIAALVNPAAIIYTEFSDIKRIIKEIKEDGTWSPKEITDDVFSGFKDYIVPVDELYIADIREHDIQKQSWLIWRRVIDYSVAEGKYGNHKNFKDFVRPGLQIIYDGTTSTFYEQFDPTLRNRLVEEIIYWNRRQDLKLSVCNGVLVCDPEYPNPRNDKKYPFAKFGFELIDEGRFFYYKSLVAKMATDSDIVNTLYRLIINGTYMQLLPSIAVFGDEQINSSVSVPGSVHQFDADTKLQPINTGGNLVAGFNAIEKVERSISESSQDTLQAGQPNKGAQTAFEISRLEQNARIMLGMSVQMIAFGVKDLGDLKLSDILQFLTVGEVSEITSDSSKMKYPTFIFPGKTSEGKTKTRQIEFTDTTNESRTSLERSFDIYKNEGGPTGDKEIFKVNPNLFRKLKYKVKVSPDLVTPPSDLVNKALMLEEYDRAIANPLVNQESITKDLLLGAYDKTKDDPDKYMKQANETVPLQGEASSNEAASSPLAKVLGSMQGQQSNLTAAL